MIEKLITWLTAVQTWLDKKFSHSVIRFSATYGSYFVAAPVEATRKIGAPWFKKMVDAAKADPKGSIKFVRCPGMFDYYQEGYLICAHTDIHIKANSVGTIVKLPLVGEPQLQPAPMDYGLVDGMAPVQDGVAKIVTKIPIPFGIYMKRGHSAHLIPALMHSPFLDKLFVYPGTVDYDKEFHVANFIFTAIKPCEFIIPAGTPLLHVLPFKRLKYHSVCGPSTAQELNEYRFGFPTRVAAYYRKMFHSKKIYTSEVEK